MRRGQTSGNDGGTSGETSGAKFGFRLLAQPELFMEIHRPNVYGGGRWT